MRPLSNFSCKGCSIYTAIEDFPVSTRAPDDPRYPATPAFIFLLYIKVFTPPFLAFAFISISSAFCCGVVTLKFLLRIGLA